MPRHFSLLLADPDSGCREQLGAVLEKDGYRVLSAGSGKEALRIAQEEALHGALLSMQMADLSWIDTLRGMKEAAATVPSILLSSEPWKELQLEALDMGVFAFMQKPVTHEILRTAVAKLLERRWPEGSLNFSIEIYKDPSRRN